MKRLVLGSAAAASAVFGLLTAAAPAHAADGPVVVYRTPFQPLSIYNDPTGCTNLPIAATQVNNQTDRDITLYADPFCLVAALPFSTIRPGYGAPVSAIGSFSAS
ncbi:hypothetical protein [Herbidospora cretacea]|uniref:hypothetical protein n=1 Tax=Herbidospora cretacea TaxID=28444 RepID=UPI0004C42999|nr:hypothetical protein [Herbidospora cretacea]